MRTLQLGATREIENEPQNIEYRKTRGYAKLTSKFCGSVFGNLRFIWVADDSLP